MSLQEDKTLRKTMIVMGQELPFNATTPNLLASAGVMGSFLAIPLFDVPLLVSVVFSFAIIATVDEVTQRKEGNKKIGQLRAHIQQAIGSDISRETAKKIHRLQLETNPQKEPPVYKRGDHKELDIIFDAIGGTHEEVGLRVNKHDLEVIRYPKEPESVTWDKAFDSTVEVFKLNFTGKSNAKLLAT